MKTSSWFRCVDDTFLLVPPNTDIFSLLSLVNYIDRSTQFTSEGKNDNSLSFLDVLVSKDIDRFSTNVFRKSLSVSLPPHVLWNHHPQQKMADIYTCIYRALHNCCHASNLSNEFIYIKLLLSLGVIAINKASIKFKKPKHPVCHSDPYLNAVVLSFNFSVSFEISQIFSRFGFNVFFRPANKI